MIRYLVFVGSALGVLIAGIGWWCPQPGPVRITNDEERPRIRISSVEHPPERVIIDTNLPTIAPLPSENFAPPTNVVQPSQQRLQDAFAGLKADPQSDTSEALVGVARERRVTKREPAKKDAAHRTSAPLNIAPAPTYSAQQSTPSTRMSFLETLKERLGQAILKLN